MAALTAGKYDAIANSMAQAIEDAMQDEWGHYHGGESLPDQGRQDRLIMFKAVARGVLGYLAQHQADIGTTPSDGSLNHTHVLDFEVSDT
jgi:hypothetical protein